MNVASRCIHGARLCVIPHPTNDYRPLVLRHKPLALVSAVLIITKVLALGMVALTPVPAELSTITSARVVQLINVERKNNGLAELSISEALTKAAQQKAQHMLDQDYFAHISPDGVTPWFWMAKNNYTYQLAGENLAIDFVEVENVVVAWMASRTHRENVLQPDFIETGVAVLTGEFQGGTSTVVVHMFGLPPGATSPAQVAAASGGQITPEPSVEPTPVKLPALDTTPPLSPVLHLVPAASTVQNDVSLRITGEAGAAITILVNNQNAVTRTMPLSGTLNVTVSLKGVPDGDLFVTAVAQDQAGNKSDTSVPLALTKDTQGPQLTKQDLVFIMSPATDMPTVVMYLPESDAMSLSIVGDKTKFMHLAAGWITFPLAREGMSFKVADAAGNVSTISDVELNPAFFVERDASYLEPPARFSNVVRRSTLVMVLAMLVLLTLAIVIHLRVQHPRMLVHGSLVLLLAVVMLFL